MGWTFVAEERTFHSFFEGRLVQTSKENRSQSEERRPKTLLHLKLRTTLEFEWQAG